MLVTNTGVDDPRVCMEADALAHQGYQLTVIGWDRDADKDSQDYHHGVQFLRLTLPSTHGRGLSQIAFLGGFWFRAWPIIRRLRPSVLHCHDLDMLPLGWRAAKSLGAYLVFDAHENYPDMMVGHLPGIAIVILRKLEQWLVQYCDLVVTVGDRLAKHYRDIGARKVVVVGNWKDPADFTFPHELIKRKREDLGINNDQVAICFVANLGRERHLEPLLKAVSSDTRFACVIGGTGPQAELVRNYAQENSNVHYLGWVDAKQIPLITAACDLTYYGFDKTNPNARWSAPNKLFEAIAAGKPILTGDFGEIGDIVRNERCGIKVNTDSSSDIKAALDRYASPPAFQGMSEQMLALHDRFCRCLAQQYLCEAYAQLVPVQSVHSINSRALSAVGKRLRQVR